jgi:F-type H+-transporting ATPase subunit b
MADTPPSPDGAAPQASGASTEAQGASSGLPQFDPTWWGGQIVWLALIFLVLYLVLAKGLLPKLGKAIDEREGKIAGDIADARRLKEEAESQAAQAEAELAEARAKAHKTAADAKAKAAANAAERQGAEEAKLNERLATAEAEIRAARDQAMTNVSAIAVETAQAIVEKLTGEKVAKTALKAAAK